MSRRTLPPLRGGRTLVTFPRPPTRQQVKVENVELILPVNGNNTQFRNLPLNIQRRILSNGLLEKVLLKNKFDKLIEQYRQMSANYRKGTVPYKQLIPLRNRIHSGEKLFKIPKEVLRLIINNSKPKTATQR